MVVITTKDIIQLGVVGFLAILFIASLISDQWRTYKKRKKDQG